MHPGKESLLEVLHLEFGDGGPVALFERFLSCDGYSRQFVLHLIDVARGKPSDSWDVRRLAALMLQRHLLTLDAKDTDEFDFVLQQLFSRNNRGGKVPESVLKEGYSTCDLRGFVAEFRRRLKRPRCALRPCGRKEVTGRDVRSFVHLSRQDCRLVLGRYLFSPDEVVARIREQVKVQEGLPLALEAEVVQTEIQQAVRDLPEYEASILEGLRSGTKVLWVADNTSSQLNSLVEYPLGTVVLVVKPPGSLYEFELKRAGRRGEHPLSARSHVPPSHRLDGGSMVSALRWDAEKTSTFSNLYRCVHGQPAPISRIVHMTGKSELPVGDGQRMIVEYLTDRGIYGDGYDEMRKAMAVVVDCFRTERGDVAPQISGDYGLTAQFFAFTGPAQAVICGSSSFRLDLLAKYLSSDGPTEYFTEGLNVDYEEWDAKMLADDLLDEVLGVYRPPPVDYRDHEQYVGAALAARKNRAKANKVYRDLLMQIGTMWGTLLAVRGYSFGESFVARNVGIRTIWSRGKWRVRLIFQDHDNLVLPDDEQHVYWPQTALPATTLDDRFIFGSPGNDSLERELNRLRRIYRVDDALQAKGRKEMRRALKQAYVKTQTAMQSDPHMQSGFDKRFVERLRDWDAVARKYLARNGSSNGTGWKSRVEKYLKKRGYSKESVEEHCRALEQHRSFIEDYAFLYRAKVDDA